MDILCNTKFDVKTYKANKKMRLQSNGCKMIITHKAQLACYKPHVWFYQKSITNLIYLKNFINQYYVTCDSLYEMFIVHR